MTVEDLKGVKLSPATRGYLSRDSREIGLKL